MPDSRGQQSDHHKPKNPILLDPLEEYVVPRKAGQHQGAILEGPLAGYPRHKSEQQMRELGRLIKSGQLNLGRFLEIVDGLHPVFRASLMRDPRAAIFCDENLRWLRAIQAALEGHAETPEASVVAAYFRICQKQGFELDPTKVAQAWLNIEQNIGVTSAVSPDATKVHDKHLFAASQYSDRTEECSPVLMAREKISVKKNDGFLPKWKRLLRNLVKKNPDDLLKHAKLGRLQHHFLTRWLLLFRGCSPSVGLCDFTTEAIVQYCCAVLRPRANEDVNYQSVYDAIRRPPLMLIARKPASVTQVWGTANFGKEVKVVILHHGKRISLEIPAS